MKVFTDASAIRTIDEKGGTEETEESLGHVGEREGTEKVLDEMLKFLGEMPLDKYHDYGDFRHKGLRGYLINLFLREKGDKDLCHSFARDLE